MSPRPLFRLVLPLTATLLLTTALPVAASQAWRWPTGGRTIDRSFQAPLTKYGSGHRGVDLPVGLGQPITAPAEAVVSFSGLVARIPTLTLDHGNGLRSSYQPLASELVAGQRVKAGQIIGIAARGNHCLPRNCLHFGVRNSTGYLDPMKLIRPRMPVLLPLLP